MKRDDLQGIRGLAIVSVLLFHFFPKIFPNGYVGVDMFFVLSGFLMALIFGSKVINRESIRNFYYRRAKRILPLYLLVITMGSLSIFFIFPSTFLSMNMDSAWNSVFLYHNMAEHSDNNMYFKMLNQADDIFTHTWSLCVEMQFYLFAPFIFWSLSLSTDKKWKPICLLILIISSLGNQLIASDQTAFNSVFCRIWQFIIGSAAFFLSEELDKDNDYELLELMEDGVITDKPAKSKKMSSLLLSISLVFLIILSFSFFPISAKTLRISSTLFTGLIILSGTHCEVNPLKNRILTYIGDISYSLYLVHWPIYVYVKHFYEDQIEYYLLAMILSIIIAIVITETFEKWYLSMDQKSIFLMLTVLYLIVISLVIGQKQISKIVDFIKYSDDHGIEEKLGSIDAKNFSISLKDSIALNRKWAREEYQNLVIPNCFPNLTEHGHCEFEHSNLLGTLKVFLVGNSYTPNLGHLVYKTFGKHARTMEKYSWSSCQVLVLDREKKCQKVSERYLAEVAKYSPDVLFILERDTILNAPILGSVSEDSLFLEAMEILKKYEKLVKHRIYLIDPITPPKKPKLSQFADLLEKGVKVTQETFENDSSYQNALIRQEELIKRCSKCQRIPISQVLHETNFTRSFNEKTKLGYFYNGLHLTPAGLNLIQPVFQKISNEFDLSY